MEAQGLQSIDNESPAIDGTWLVLLESDPHRLEPFQGRTAGLNRLVLTLNLFERIAEFVEATTRRS